MRAVVYHEVWGEIVYEESEWSGKKSITVGGQRLEKIKRGLYYFPEHQDIFVQVIGNYFWGARIYIKTERIDITPIGTKLDYFLSMLLCAFIIVWGNTVKLSYIIPIVGGAVGGAFSGVMAIATFMMIKVRKQLWRKLLILIGMTALTFIVCAIIAAGLYAII